MLYCGMLEKGQHNLFDLLFFSKMKLILLKVSWWAEWKLDLLFIFLKIICSWDWNSQSRLSYLELTSFVAFCEGYYWRSSNEAKSIPLLSHEPHPFSIPPHLNRSVQPVSFWICSWMASQIQKAVQLTANPEYQSRANISTHPQWCKANVTDVDCGVEMKLPCPKAWFEVLNHSPMNGETAGDVSYPSLQDYWTPRDMAWPSVPPMLRCIFHVHVGVWGHCIFMSPSFSDCNSFCLDFSGGKSSIHFWLQLHFFVH